MNIFDLGMVTVLQIKKRMRVMEKTKRIKEE